MSGRMKKLRTSISPITGAKMSGRPLPTRLEIFFGRLALDARTLPSHRGRATAAVNTRWLESLNTHGTRPAKFTAANIRNKDVRSHAVPWIALLPLLLIRAVGRVLAEPMSTFLRLLMTKREGKISAVIKYVTAQNPTGES